MTKTRLSIAAAAAAALFVALVASPPVALSQTAGWWKPAWQARRVVKAPVPVGVEADELAGVAHFATHGRAKPDGSDIRVIAKGKELPCRVLRMGPGDLATVAFELVADADSYQIYYGNPKAEAPKVDWEIRAGMLMEVKRYKGGGYNHLKEAIAAWNRSDEVLGRDFVPTIFLGYNPFGPNNNFMAHYTGWFNVEKAGTYEFATTSSNASFILVDGKEVVGWGGGHGAIPRARFTGKVDLAPGRHKLEYYHINPFGDAIAVAAWKRPGDERIEVIPHQAFLAVSQAVVQPEQVQNQALTPDFDWARGEAFLDPNAETLCYRFEFHDLAAGTNRRYLRPFWDFGDGVTSAVWQPVHVYLAPGTYTVTYELKGPQGDVSVRQRIVVERDWAHQSTSGEEKIASYYAVVRSYDFRKMPAESLAAACEFFDRLKKYEDLGNVEHILLFDTPNLRDDLLLKESVRIAETFLDRMRKPADAIDIYLNAEKRAGSEEAKAQMLLRAAAILRRETFDLDRAEGFCQKVLSAYRKVKPETRRRALAGLGEVAALSGKADDAKKYLSQADAIPVTKRDVRGDIVRVGSLSRAIEDYTRRSEFAEAQDLLDAWEWEYPLDRLVGYSTVLRAKLCMKREEYAKAVRLLMSLVAVNPLSNYAGEALFTAGECYEKLGDKAKATEAWNRLIRDFPESPFVKEAQKRLMK